MIRSADHLNEDLKARLTRLSDCNKDYWSFKGNSRRDHGHGYFQYPAMMVPQMVRAILDEACLIHPEIERVYDPFSGSGTILTESMLKGLSFEGRDINPLAVLLCRTKSGPFFSRAIIEKSKTLISRIECSWSEKVDISFSGIDKWFREDVQISLSRIRRAIIKEPSLWARRFFWVAFAEVVRLSSNSRTSTFKLHIRPTETITSRKINPSTSFKRILQRNLEHFNSQSEYLKNRNFLRKGRYKGDLNVSLGDTRTKLGETIPLCDILITSPPYGDNSTTVPYGQYSYLPLQWIPLSDIDENIDNLCLSTTQQIDSMSLGGKRRIEDSTIQDLSARSDTYKEVIRKLSCDPPDRAKKVTAFIRDLNACVSPITENLHPGGLMVWTLGNRHVAGKSIPLDTILQELLEFEGAATIAKLKRKIISKRMALKNNIANTMSDETILVMRKAVQNA